MIKIISDTHIGVNRASHTSPASRERLKKEVYEQALMLTKGEDTVLHLGDLFDQHWCDANSLMQGVNLASQCDVLLVGNHDVSNRLNTSSAMQFIRDLHGNHTVRENEPTVSSVLLEGLSIQWVNHKMTQKLFAESLGLVKESDILLLHCNYDSGFAKDEASLNLTRMQAQGLLEKVKYIFIGHEHISRADFDGRLVLVGNTFPTSFSDISDKFAWTIHPETLSVTRECVWKKAQHYHKMEWGGQLPEGDIQFLEIVGEVDSNELPAIARFVAMCWKHFPSALMIRNAVTVEGKIKAPTELKPTTDTLSAITQELAGTKLAQLWAQYLETVE